MTRYCVCISGQIRASPAAFRSLREVTIGHDVTFVYSVWDRIGRKLEGALNHDQLARMFETDAYLALPTAWHGHAHVWTALPTLRRRLENAQQPQVTQIESMIRDYFPVAVVDVEPSDLLDLSFGRLMQDSNSMRMTYKIWRANQIKRRLERDTGKFDVVVRLRPDLAVDNLDLHYVADRVSKGCFLVDGWFADRNYASDFFAAGSSDAMDAYCAIFSRAIAMPQSWELIHATLVTHLQACSLNVETYSFAPWLADEEQISLDQFCAALHELRETREVWDHAHELALAAASALQAARAQDAPSALDILHEAAPAASKAGLRVTDSYLVVLAQVLRQLEELDAAAACALAAPNWAAEDPRRRLLVDVVTSTVARYIDSHRTFEPAAIAVDLARGVRPAWVAKLLSDLTGGPSLETWLAAQIATVGREPEICKVVWQVLRDTQNVAGLTRLAADLDGYLVAEREKGSGSSRRVPLLMMIADAYEAVGDRHCAIVSLREAAEFSPGNIDMLYRLADMLKSVEQFEEARTVQARAVAARPSHPGANRQLAELCLHLRDVKAGLHFAQRAMQLHDNPTHRLLLAFALHLHGEPQAEAVDAGLPIEFLRSATFGHIPGMPEFKASLAAKQESIG